MHSRNSFLRTVIAGACLFLITGTTTAQVGINPTGSAPHPLSALDLDYNNRGFLPPRLTSAERDALTAPLPEGLTMSAKR